MVIKRHLMKSTESQTGNQPSQTGNQRVFGKKRVLASNT